MFCLTACRPALAAVAVALMLGVTAPAHAQPARPGPYIPPGARGFQISQAQMAYYQAAEANRSYHLPAAEAPDTSAVEAPRYVSIRTPDGGVRWFLLEGPVTVVPFHPGVVAHYPPEAPVAVARFHPGVVAHEPH